MICLLSAASMGWDWDPAARSSDACYQQLVSGRADGSGVCFGSEASEMTAVVPGPSQHLRFQTPAAACLEDEVSEERSDGETP